jgi:hypothetical protein
MYNLIIKAFKSLVIHILVVEVGSVHFIVQVLDLRIRS